MSAISALLPRIRWSCCRSNFFSADTTPANGMRGRSSRNIPSFGPAVAFGAALAFVDALTFVFFFSCAIAHFGSRELSMILLPRAQPLSSRVGAAEAASAKLYGHVGRDEGTRLELAFEHERGRSADVDRILERVGDDALLEAHRDAESVSLHLEAVLARRATSSPERTRDEVPVDMQVGATLDLRGHQLVDPRGGGTSRGARHEIRAGERSDRPRGEDEDAMAPPPIRFDRDERRGNSSLPVEAHVRRRATRPEYSTPFRQLGGVGK
jgi:hypothetical protein